MSQTDPPTPIKDRRPRGVFWLTLLCVLAASTAVGMSVWVPRLQQRRALDEISRMGGKVYAQPPSSHPGDRILAELTGSGRNVVAIDLSAGRLNDEKLDVLAAFPSVRFLTLSGPDLTNDGLRRLSHLQHLERLILVNCPQIGESAEYDLQAANPGLKISRRGPALLGVTGEPGPHGCRVVGVRAGTAADRGGVRFGDVITAINGRRIDSFESLARQIARFQPGEEIVLTILRDGRPISVTVKLGSWEGQT